MYHSQGFIRWGAVSSMKYQQYMYHSDGFIRWGAVSSMKYQVLKPVNSVNLLSVVVCNS